MSNRDEEAVKAIRVVQSYLMDELITPECIYTPCIGCVSCNAVELRTKLEALANFVCDATTPQRDNSHA